ACQIAPQAGVLNSALHGRHVLPGDGAAEDLVHDLEIRAPRQRLHRDLAVAELAVPAGLFLVAPVCLDLGRDGLSVRDARRFERDLDAEPAAELRYRDF